MASSVIVEEEVLQVFNEMKLSISSAPEDDKMRMKAVLFRISEDKKKIIVEEGKKILFQDIGKTVDDSYSNFIQMLPDDDCRYGLYKVSYETCESKKKEGLVFIFWSPEGAEVKKKMTYARAQDALRRKFSGLEHVWQVNRLDDIQNRTLLAKKLGGDLVTLEGKPL